MSGQVSRKNLFISSNEAADFLNSIKSGGGEEKYRLLILLVSFGCRPCEAVALHISDFIKADFTQFYVNNTKVARNGAAPRRDLKFIPKWFGEELRRYVTQRHAYGELKGGFLFPTNSPRRYAHMQSKSLTAYVWKKRQQLGITEISAIRSDGKPQYRFQLYSFRRLLATEDAAKGVNPMLTAARMGHLDTKTTARYVDMKRLHELLPEVVENTSPPIPKAGQTKIEDFLKPCVEVVFKAPEPLQVDFKVSRRAANSIRHLPEGY